MSKQKQAAAMKRASAKTAAEKKLESFAPPPAATTGVAQISGELAASIWGVLENSVAVAFDLTYAQALDVQSCGVPTELVSEATSNAGKRIIVTAHAAMRCLATRPPVS